MRTAPGYEYTMGGSLHTPHEVENEVRSNFARIANSINLIGKWHKKQNLRRIV